MKKIIITLTIMSMMFFPYCFTNVINADNSAEYNAYTENEFIALNQRIYHYKKAHKSAYNTAHYRKLLYSKNQYKEYIYLLKTKSTSELREMNYNNSQIKAIHNYDGSDGLSARIGVIDLGRASLYN